MEKVYEDSQFKNAPRLPKEQSADTFIGCKQSGGLLFFRGYQ